MALRPLNGLALCAGAGGLELGVSGALPHHRTVCYVEREAFAARTLVARMEEPALGPAPIWDDLATFDGRPWRGVVDLVSTGIPCQPFSTAGSKAGIDDERWLWPDVERVLREIQPRWLFLENVPGLVRHGLGPLLGGLARLGFDAEWDLFSAEAVGAPHKRERFFLLARRVSDAVGDSVRQQPERGSGRAQAPDERHAVARDLVEAMDDAERAELQRELFHPGQGREGRGAGHADRAEPELADISGGGRGKLGRAARQGGRGHADRGDEELAESRRELLEGRHERPEDQRDDRRAGSPGRSTVRQLFPPGPDQIDVWAEVLAETPEVEPSLCRVAHGLAYRVDRLRACGNGVVPLQAAVALLTLADRAGWLAELRG